MSTANLQSSQYIHAAEEQEKPEGRTAGTYVTLIGLLAVMGGASYVAWNFYQQQDHVAAVAVVLVAFGALNGFRRGLLGMIISLIAFGVAYHFAPQFGVAFEDAFSEQFGTAGLLNRGLTIASAGVLTFVGFNLFSSLVLRILLGKPTKKLSLNRLLGFAAGAAQSALAILLFLGGYLVLEPTLPKEPVPPAMARFTEQVHSTQLRPLVEQYNPFLHVPQLNGFERVKQMATALADPTQVKRILLHPSIKELREQPATKDAMLGLIRDPEIAAMLKSKQRLDEKAMQKVLQNEAVLTLLDQPEFLERAQQVISEM